MKKVCLLLTILLCMFNPLAAANDLFDQDIDSPLPAHSALESAIATIVQLCQQQGAPEPTHVIALLRNENPLAVDSATCLNALQEIDAITQSIDDSGCLAYLAHIRAVISQMYELLNDDSFADEETPLHDDSEQSVKGSRETICNLLVKNLLKVCGHAYVEGQLIINPRRSIRSSYPLLVVNGDTDVNGTLTVDNFVVEGTTTLGNVVFDNVSVNGNLSVVGNSTLNTLAAASATLSALTVNGTSALNGQTSITLAGGQTLSVNGGLFEVDQLGNTTTNDLTVNGTFTVPPFGNTTINGTLDVTGATTLQSTLNVTGTSTLAATNTTTLSSSGLATLNSLDVTPGNATIAGTLSAGATTLNSLGVTTNATVGGNLGVTGNTSLSTVSSSGLATLNSVSVPTTLGVTGVSTFNSTVNMTPSSAVDALVITPNASSVDGIQINNPTNAGAGGFAFKVDNGVPTPVFSIAHTTGNTLIGGTLGVTGASTLAATNTTTLSSSGLATLNSVSIPTTLSVTGTTTLSDTLAINPAAGNAITVNGTDFIVDFQGNTTTNNLTVNGTFSVPSLGNTTINGTLDVTGATTLQSTLNVTGTSTLAATNTTTLSSSGLATLNSVSVPTTLGVTGISTFNSTVNMTPSSAVDALVITPNASSVDGIQINNPTNAGAGGFAFKVDNGVPTPVFSIAHTTGNTLIGGTLGVTGTSTLAATNTTTLSSSGLATLNSLDVTPGNATIAGTLSAGATTLNSLGVTTNATITGTLGVTGNTSLSTVSTSGLATLNSLSVTPGDATFAANINLPNTANANVGVIEMNNIRYFHNYPGNALNPSVFVGSTSGNFTMTGVGNTCVGTNTGLNFTSATSNTLIGRNAGRSIQTATSSTIMGNNSGFDLVSGDNNLFLGADAGPNITSGSNNIIIGTEGPTGVVNNQMYLGSSLQTSMYLLSDDGTSTALPTQNLSATVDVMTINNTTGLVGRTSSNPLVIPSTTVTNNASVGGTLTVTGDASFSSNINLPNTANANVGVIERNNIRYFHNYTTNPAGPNLFVGSESGNFTMTGLNNVCLGARTGQSITNGSSNTLVGQDAGAAIAGANSITCLGRNAGLSLVSGSDNLFLGGDAGSGITSGSNTTIIGSDGPAGTVNNSVYFGRPTQTSLFLLSNDGSSTGVPTQNLSASVDVMTIENATGAVGRTSSNPLVIPSTTVTNNATVGGTLSVTGNISTSANFILPAGNTSTEAVIYRGASTYIHTFGTLNTFVGVASGNLTLTGNGRNAGFGSQALTALTSGESNSAFGSQAGFSLQNGNNNTLVGRNAGRSLTSASDNTMIGHNSGDLITTGGLNTFVGVNTGTALPTSSNGNTLIGANAGSSINVASSTNTFVGRSAGANLLSGSDNLLLGVNAGVSMTSGNNNIMLGNVGLATVSSTIFIGNPSQATVYLTSNAGVPGLTTSAAAANLVLDATTGQVTRSTSSARYKMNIADLPDSSTTIIDSLRPVSYNHINNQTTTSYGLIAEEVDILDPNLVAFDDQNRPDSVNYTYLIPLLIKAYQQQKARIDQLEAQVASL